jgi:L-fuconolactonase
MPWLDGDAWLNRPFEPEQFADASADVSVEAIVYVQVDATPAYGLLETQWAAQQPRVAAVVAFAPIEDGAVARSYLTALKKIKRVHGVRRLIQSESQEFPLQLIDGLRVLPQYNLTFDICIRHEQLAHTIEMVKACPETQFVLDHLGKPPIREQRLEPWRQHLSDLAALPNVMCKISGAVTEADHERWTPHDLAPFIQHALDAFGEDRVLFGSDWPVVTHAASYRHWVETLRELTKGLSDQAKRKLWHENARRVYGL